MQALFNRLPSRLFSPLSGVNRDVYARLLLDLYPLFFDQIHADVFPSRDALRYEIEEQFARLTLVWQEEAEDAQQLGDEGPLAATIYRRLRDAGWFEEERDGYRVYVTVPPAVAMLWSTLMEIARPDKVFYGGMVLSIHNNLQQAMLAPEQQALALRQAASEAKRFLQHLNGMIYGLKGMLQQFRELDDHRQVLRGFFENFVEHFLVQDYKRLTTRNNPFRFRQQILDGVRELAFDLPRQQALVKGYMEQSGEADEDAARLAVDNDIDRLRRTFEQLDAHLQRINRYRARVESRVADTVRYLDRSQPGMSARLAGIYQQLAARVATLDDDAELDWLPLRQPPPASEYSLAEPRKLRTPPPPEALRSRQPTARVKQRQAELRAYLDRRRIDFRRIEAYLERQMAQADSVPGQAMSINGVEDFIAFAHLRHLPYLPGAGRLRRHYRIERLEGNIDNDWLRSPAFIVHRKPTGSPHAA